MRKTLPMIGLMLAIAGAVFLATAAPSSAQSAASIAPRSIGWVGCSNTRDSVTGFATIKGNNNAFWDPNKYNTDGGIIGQWSTSKSGYWASFDRQVGMYGQPAFVWVELCEDYTSQHNTYSQVQQIFTNLKKHAPKAAYYVSAINEYNPTTLCSMMGPQGQGETDTQQWRDQAVSDRLALLGPSMGPLTILNTITDHCHPNTLGKSLLGGQIFNFIF